MVKITFTPKATQDAPGNITEPRTRAAYMKLEQKEKAGVASVKESRQYHRLKKYGDAAQNIASITGSKPSPAADLAKLNQATGSTTRGALERVIDRINEGLNPIKACEEINIKPKEFYKKLDEAQNFDLKIEFMRARCMLAEYYLNRREELEQDLKAGRIDPSTYSCLSTDYKYLAAKLAPLAYGEKIQLDAMITKAGSEPSADKISELNKLLIDASYTLDD